MRKLIATAVTALTAAGLAVGTPGPVRATELLDPGPPLMDGWNLLDIHVVSTGPGDAVAAWQAGFGEDWRIWAATAVDGEWGAAKPVSPEDVVAVYPRLAANERGDVVLTWRQTGNFGAERVRGARKAGAGWTQSIPLTPATGDVEQYDVAVDDSGTAILVAQVDVDDTPVDQVVSTTWRRGEKKPEPRVVATEGHRPNVAMNGAGTALMTYDDPSGPNGRVLVRRRTAGSGWSNPQVVIQPGAGTTGIAQVGIGPKGHGVVVVEHDDLMFARRIGATGAVAPLDQLTTDGDGSFASISVNAGGNALVAWASFAPAEGTTYTSLRNGTWSEPATLPGTPSLFPGVHLADNGAQYLASTQDGTAELRHRRNPIFGFDDHVLAADVMPSGDLAMDVDSEGNAVVLVHDGPDKLLTGRFLDAAGPASRVTGPGPVTFTTAFGVAWSATDALRDVANTDVYVSSAAWNQGALGDPVAVQLNDTASPSPFAGAVPGSTYCFETQSVDTADTPNLGLRSPLRCTALPLDDRALSGKRWKKSKGKAHYLGTIRTTTKQGRTLVKRGVKARRIALVVARSPKGGKVRVTFAGKSLGTFDLKGRKGTRKVVDVATFPKVRSGTVRIVVTSPTGRVVQIDGLVVGK